MGSLSPIPRPDDTPGRAGALHVARQGIPIDDAAMHFGVSKQMMR